MDNKFKNGPNGPQNPKEESRVGFSPRIQELQDKKVTLFQIIPLEKRGEVAREFNERAMYLLEKYPDSGQREVFHVIVGSSLPKDRSAGEYTDEDYPGEDSVERFIDHIIAKYTI